MKYTEVINSPSKSPYAPTWKFTLATATVADDVDCKKLSKTILSKEKEILKLPPVFDGYTGLGKNSITARSTSYNLLEWNTPEIVSLKNLIAKSIITYTSYTGNELTSSDLVSIQCWANIIRFGQKMKPHIRAVHPYSYLSGDFIVQSHKDSYGFINPVNQINDPEIISGESEVGLISLFPSYVPSYTTRHWSLIPQIIISFDVICDLRGLTEIGWDTGHYISL